MKLKSRYSLNKGKLRMSRNKYNIRVYLRLLRGFKMVKYRNESLIIQSRLRGLLYPISVKKMNYIFNKVGMELTLRYILYVSGFGVSLAHCDHLIRKGYVFVNGFKICNLFYACKVGDKVNVSVCLLDGLGVKFEWLGLPYYLLVNRSLGTIILLDKAEDLNYLSNKV